MKRTDLHVYLVCGREKPKPGQPAYHSNYIREHVVAAKVHDAIAAVEELHPGCTIESAAHHGANVVMP